MAGYSDPWDSFPAVGASSPAPKREDPIIRPADPYRDEDQQFQRDNAARAADDEARKNRGEARDIAKFNSDQGNDVRDYATTLRKEFSSLPQVQEYQTIIRQYASALRTEPTPMGDQALITAYAKMLDPTSVVREQEFNTVANSDSRIGQLVARLGKELGVDGAGMLRPEVRNNLRREMQNLTRNYNTSYNQAREQYRRLAERSGTDPEGIIGQHLGAPYLSSIESYWRDHRDPATTEGAPPANVPAPGGNGGSGAPGGNGPTPGSSLSPQQSAQFWGQDVYDQSGQPLGKEGGGAYDRNGNYMGIFGSVTEDDAGSPLDTRLIAQGRGVVASAQGSTVPSGTSQEIVQQTRKLADLEGDQSGIAGVMTLAKSGITGGLLDEVHGIGGAASALLTGKDPTQAYYNNRNAEREVIDRARQAHPTVGGTAELLGSFAGAGVGNLNAAVPTVAQAARTGAGLGALQGYATGNGVEDSLADATVGAVTGGALGAGMQKAAPYVAEKVGQAAERIAPPGSRIRQLIESKRASLAPNIDREVIAAGERQGIPIRQPDARPAVRNDMAVAETSQYGGPMIREARAADQVRMEQRVGEVGGRGDPSLDPYALGSKIQGAGQSYIAKTKAEADRLYKTARENSGGQSVSPTDALAAIDQNIAELQAAGGKTNRGQIAYLEDLRADMATPGGLTIEAMQSLRTNMRGQLSERGLTGTDADRRVKQVIDAANVDLTRDLPPEASTALRAADQFYRKRQEFIDSTLKQFLGSRGEPIAAETAASRLASMIKGKGNFDRFSRMWSEIPPEDRADIAATVAHSLGRKANGEFSPATLLTSLDPVKP